MPNVTLKCQSCNYKTRRPLATGIHQVGCRGIHETPSEDACCPNGHGQLVREDGGQTELEVEAKL